MDFTFQWERRQTIKKEIRLWKCDKAMKTHTRLGVMRGPGAVLRRWVECKASSHWLWKTDHTQLFLSPMMLQTGPPFPELVVGMEQHSTDEKPAEGLSLKGHQGKSQPCDFIGGRRSKPRDPEAEFVGNQERWSTVFSDENRILL